MYITIDFDNTIAVSKITGTKVSIIRNKFLAKQVINDLYKNNIITINTLREGKLLEQAKKYLKKSGIKYHYINENPKELIEKWGESRKIAGDIYIDDRNIVPLVSWPIIWVVLKIKLWIKKIN